MANRSKSGTSRKTNGRRRPAKSRWRGARGHLTRALASVAGHAAALLVVAGLFTGGYLLEEPYVLSSLTDSEAQSGFEPQRLASSPQPRPVPRAPVEREVAHLLPDTSIRTGALPAPPRARPEGPEASGAIRRAMPICGNVRRVNCVVDGDTIWLSGEKIRLETINAPEIKGECEYETLVAEAATRRLSALLSSGSFRIERSGMDRYGRTLARLRLTQGEVGAILVDEGLAHRWHGRKESWCRA